MLIVVLRAALVLALVGACWSVYRRLPHDESSIFNAGHTKATKLRIVMRNPISDGVGANAQLTVTPRGLSVQLYSIDVASTQREFLSEPQRGVALEDFMSRRMGDRPAVEGSFDERGQATVSVLPGLWWVHATLPAAQEITWRLRVNVSGREQTIELTPENAFTRTKSF